MQRFKDFTEKQLYPRRKMEDLPLYYRPSSSRYNNKGISIPSLSSAKWIHLIPIGVLLCLFILWWFSYPVILEIKDGRIKEVHKILEVVPSELLNETTSTNVDLTILAMATATATASASAPFTSIIQRQHVENGTAAEPVSNDMG